ncbi:hypothetical protein DMP23_47215 [Amycolatopsis sp. A1MSW2902]|uniref:hypothetical protein n=1 Tax=Amycolatopsis sp. A1MSW2902 TaxID=687413 RepID=UPI00307E040B
MFAGEQFQGPLFLFTGHVGQETGLRPAGAARVSLGGGDRDVLELDLGREDAVRPVGQRHRQRPAQHAQVHRAVGNRGEPEALAAGPVAPGSEGGVLLVEDHVREQRAVLAQLFDSCDRGVDVLGDDPLLPRPAHGLAFDQGPGHPVAPQAGEGFLDRHPAAREQFDEFAASHPGHRGRHDEAGEAQQFGDSCGLVEEQRLGPGQAAGAVRALDDLGVARQRRHEADRVHRGFQLRAEPVEPGQRHPVDVDLVGQLGQVDMNQRVVSAPRLLVEPLANLGRMQQLQRFVALGAAGDDGAQPRRVDGPPLRPPRARNALAGELRDRPGQGGADVQSGGQQRLKNLFLHHRSSVRVVGALARDLRRGGTAEGAQR